MEIHQALTRSKIIRMSFRDMNKASVPLVAITGQVPRRMIGPDAFQETLIAEVTRSITKHNYLVLDVDDIPRILAVPNWNQPFRLSGYMSRLPKAAGEAHLEQIVRLISESKKPVFMLVVGV
ncbi:hypothetical protein DITRI_Ditri17bG0018900 [Diplodiscus trichospermus]